MQTPGILDPAQFLVIPHTAVLDTFKMSDDSGAFLADINEDYLDRFIAHMNERERLTGDLAPLVVGHTSDDPVPECDTPQIVGYARNYTKDQLGETDRKAAFADFWIYKKDVDLVRKHGMRRSCEIWVSRYEADPISLLGATTPCRDLGLLKLSRDGAIKLTHYTEGQLMPDEKLPPADPKESGKEKGKEAEMSQVLAMLSEVLAAIKGGATPAPGAPPAAGGEPELSDEEYEKLLSQLDPSEGMPDEKGKDGEKPVKESSAACGSDDQEMKKLERTNGELQIRLSRMEIERALDKMSITHDVQVDDTLIADLAALPPDMRGRQLDRIQKLSRPKVGSVQTPLDRALADAPVRQGKRLTDRDEQLKLIKLARSSGKTFEAVLAEAGYDVN